MNLFDLVATLSLDSSAFDKGLSTAENVVKNFGGMLGTGFTTAVKVGTAALETITTTTINFGKKIFNNASEVAVYGDNIDKMSQKMGLSAEKYQEWDAILQHSGTSIGSMTGAMKTMQLAAERGSGAFEQLGISQEELANMSTEDMFSAVITGLQGMESGSERTKLATALLGRGAMELGALLNTSAEDTEAMRQRVHELGGVMSDEAVKSAALFQDNMQDLQTAIDGVKRGISAEFLPGLNDLIDGFTRLIAGEADANEIISKGLDATFTAFSTNFNKITELAGKILPEIVNSFVENLPLLTECAINLLQTMINAILASLPEFISIGTQIFTKLLNSITTNLPEFIQAGTQAIVQLSTGLSEAIPTLVPVVKESIIQIAEILTSSDSLSQLLDAGIELFQAVLDGLIGSGELITSLGDAITTIIEFLVNSIPELIQAGTDIITAVIDAFPDIIAALLETDIIENIINTLLESLPRIMEAGIQLLTALVNGAPIVITNIIGAIPPIIDGIISAILGNLPQIINAGVQLLTSLVGNLSEIISKIVAVLPELINNILTTLLSFIPDLIAAGIELFVALINALPTIISSIVGAIPDIIDAVIDTLMDAIPLLIDAGIELFIALVDNLPAIITGIVNAIPKIIVSITSKLGDLIPKLVQAGVDLFVAIVKDLPKIIVTIVSKIPEIVTGIVSGFSDLATQMWTVGENMLKGLWDGISGAAGWLWDQISNWAGGLWDGICDFFGIHSPSTLFRDGLGKNMALGLGQGFVKAMDDVNKDMVNAIPTDFDVSPNVDVNSSYSAAGAGGISGNFSPISFGQGVHISLNIENFNNYTDDDIDNLTDRLITSISEKMSRRGAVYA